MKKRWVYWGILLTSLIVNFVYFKYDTLDYVWPKITTKYFSPESIDVNDSRFEEHIVDASIKMLNGSPVMVWDDGFGFARSLLERGSITNKNEFRTYNYPRAFLYYGISEYLILHDRNHEMLELKRLFDDLYDFNNLEIIEIRRIDEVPFGLTALNLYEYFNDEKYLNFCGLLYSYIKNMMDDQGIIMYRKGQPAVLNDMLGMVGPFLARYGKYDSSSYFVLKKQLDFFIRNGVDAATHIPVHAVHKKTTAKLGSANWGRGIGWYLIALADYNRVTGGFQSELDGLIESLDQLRGPHQLWNQFPGSVGRFDASATTLFLHGMNAAGKAKYQKKEVVELLQKYISKDGEILSTSGDTRAVNNYSTSFGKSELSQGMLLLILANLN